MAETPIQLPYLKDSAVVRIELNKFHITQLQHSLNQLLKGHDKTTIEAIKDKISAKTELDVWELASFTLANLLQVVSIAAKEQDQLEYRSVESVLSTII